MDTTRELIVKDIKKTFKTKDGFNKVLDGVSFEVYKNEFLVLLGPGRCGKTVLLNIIAGLIEASEGEVEFPNKVKNKPVEIGFVYQRTSLMPWKTVMGNVEFCMKVQGVPKKERRKVAQQYINLVGLEGFEKHYPHQLSGGMQQRVGIARAYTTKPQILLMDEPFGQLDAQTRYSMQNEVLKIYEHDKRTIVFVTNNIEEALYLGDRIILLSSYPSKVKKEYRVDLKRPRDMMDSEFLKLRQEISDNMELVV